MTFASPVDGAKVFMGPEESMQVQRDLGSDIVFSTSARRTRPMKASRGFPWNCVALGPALSAHE